MMSHLLKKKSIVEDVVVPFTGYRDLSSRTQQGFRTSGNNDINSNNETNNEM